MGKDEKIERRTFLKGAAALGGAVVWGTPSLSSTVLAQAKKPSPTSKSEKREEVLNEKEIGPVTLKVAKWATELKYEDIPKNVMDYGKMVILDGIGCSVMGSSRQAGALIIDYVGDLEEGKPEATIWGKSKKVPIRLAALANGTSAHTANIGDTHRSTIVHANYLMPQASIAVAEKEGLGGKEVLTAIIAGNEVCIRAALATHIGQEGGYFAPEGRGWHTTGALGAIGTAIATGKLLGLSTGKMVQALVMGGTQPSGIYRPSGPYMGKHLFAGKAVANGIESGYIARKGFIAGYKLFEDGLCFSTGIISPVFELDAAAKGLGERWETLETALAIYPTKKTFMTNLDALLAIIKTEKIAFKDIERVRAISAFAQSHAFRAYNKPKNATDAFNSFHFVMAVAAHDGYFFFDQLGKDKFEDPEILAFAQDRIEIVRDQGLEKLVPQKWPGGAEVITKDGRKFSKQFDFPVGEPENPISKEQLEEKFLRMTSQVLGKGKAAKIIDAVYGMESLQEMDPLTRLLRP